MPVRRRSGALRFCTRCGVFAQSTGWRSEAVWHDRVCTDCGMGVLLSCDLSALETPGSAFLVVGGSLRVSAMSEAAERIFGNEEASVGRALLELVSSPLGDEELTRRVSQAAWAERPPTGLPITLRRPASRSRGALSGRVATCGPPRAALVVVEPAAGR